MMRMASQWLWHRLSLPLLQAHLHLLPNHPSQCHTIPPGFSLCAVRVGYPCFGTPRRVNGKIVGYPAWGRYRVHNL